MPALADALLEWYDTNARVLPWRSHPSPYPTWISEVMLQQTQVNTVLPYFERWMERFPSISSLAEADLEEVLKLWEGLGYYGRARNIHRTAQLLIAEHSGELPSDQTSLLKLPGVGKYIACAIQSIAFGQQTPVIDGNIRRVYSRVFAIDQLLGTPESENLLWDFAVKTLPETRAGDFNQALMDLGALICLPRTPDCKTCPITNFCLAYQTGRQHELPRKTKKEPIPHITVTAAVITQNTRILVQKRPEGGLLGGLWEFPGGKLESFDSGLEACLKREIMEELEVNIAGIVSIGVFKHAYTHFRVTLHAFACQLEKGEFVDESGTVRWVLPSELGELPMGKIDRMIASQLLKDAPTN